MNMIVLHDKSIEYMQLIHDQVMEIRNRVNDLDRHRLLTLLLLEQDMMFTIIQYQRLVHEINPDKLPLPTKAQLQSIADMVKSNQSEGEP